MATIQGNWFYLEDDDPANLPSFRHICMRCGVAFSGYMVTMGFLLVHEQWHENLEAGNAARSEH